MNHLNLQSPQITLELPAAALERDLDRTPERVAPDDELGAARGILFALGLSACMWLMVLAAIWLF